MPDAGGGGGGARAPCHSDRGCDGRRLPAESRGGLHMVQVQAAVPSVVRGQGVAGMSATRDPRTSPAVRAALKGFVPTDEQWRGSSHFLEPLFLIAGAGSGENAGL